MEGLRYVPYFELTGVPHVIADGQARRSTVLTLSHWPDSGTPDELARDLSAEIALAYLASPEHHVDADAVSNNHLDIDGFMSVWALCNPAAALADPGLVAEVARAGDFGWTHDRRAARVAFALGVMKEPELSPLPTEVFDDSDPHRVANLYGALLESFESLVAGIDDREDLWADQQRHLDLTEAALQEGRIEIEERPEHDLAIVTVDPSVPPGMYPYCLQHAGPCHPMPIHAATECSRILYLKGDWAGLVYRFESWVNFRSRRVPRRVDLSALALDLTGGESAGVRWTYAWPQNPNPPVAWLTTERNAPTSIDAQTIVTAVLDALAATPPSTGHDGPATYSRQRQP